MRRPCHAPFAFLLTVSLMAGCTVRDLTGPERRQAALVRPEVSPATWARADEAGAGLDGGALRAQSIAGTVRAQPSVGRYRLRAFTQTPLEGAEVRLGRLDNPKGELGEGTRTNASGRYRLEQDKLGRPLFVRATWSSGGEAPLTLDAPVPIVSTREVLVDVDMVSHLMTQVILERAKTPDALTAMLTPAFLASLRASLTAGLSDENAPNLGSPTETLAAAERLLEGASGALALLPSPVPPAPLPAGETIPLADHTPGPANSDPPVIADAGARGALTPAWARYKGVETTGLTGPAALACGFLEAWSDVLFAGLDGQSGTVFLYLRDTGMPGTLSAQETEASAPVALALDGKAGLLVAGKRQIVRVTLQLKADRPTALNAVTLVTPQADVTALAADPARLVAALADGRLLRYDLARGQLETAFSPKLPAAATALALDEEGGGVALLADTGALHRFTGSGQVESRALATLPGATMLTGSLPEGLFAASPGGTVWRLLPPALPSTVLTGDATVALARRGQYLFRLDPEGNLDTLALDP